MNFKLTCSQYVDDSSFRNHQWSRIAQIFTAREVGNAELALLHALGWDLSITENEVLRHWTTVVRRTTGRYESSVEAQDQWNPCREQG